MLKITVVSISEDAFDHIDSSYEAMWELEGAFSTYGDPFETLCDLEENEE